jgi:hypothetical protein
VSGYSGFKELTLTTLTVLVSALLAASSLQPAGGPAPDMSTPATQAQAGPQAAARNVQLRHLIPDTQGAISMTFTEYGDREVLFLSGQFGLKTYDVTNVDQPVFLDHLTKQQLALPGDDPEQRFWENEDVNVDPKRKLVFLAREVSAFGRGQSQVRPTGVYLVSAQNPADLTLMSFQPMGTGHITTCINACQYLWTTGADRTGGKGQVFVTDIRDAANPKNLPNPVDLGRNQGESATTHDVQVDAQGVAWVAGTGGTRGYWTSGRHRDPLTGKIRQATAVAPIPYAGGAADPTAMPTSFSHNSFRPVGRTLDDGPRPTRDNPAGSLLLHTEEAFGSATCKDQGRFVISSLTGSHGGESWRATKDKPYHLRTVGVWSPDDQEGTIPEAFCSAHYFDVSKRIVAYSWYEQGTRFLDISNPAKPIQIAYWRPEGAVSFAPYWHKNRAYVADLRRGVEILSLTDNAYTAQATGTNVVLKAEPTTARAAKVRPARLPYAPDPDYGHACLTYIGSRTCGTGSCC